MKLRIFEECMIETLYKGDCLIEMNKITDKSVDMILCDLPFQCTANKWDIMIPFDKLWEQYNRIVKPNGAIVLFGSEPFTSKLICSNMNYYSHSWIWDKNIASNYPLANKQPLKMTEDIVVFYRTINDIEQYEEIRCVFRDISAEHIDIKEFTSGQEVFGCIFYGDGMTGENYAGITFYRNIR